MIFRANGFLVLCLLAAFVLRAPSTHAHDVTGLSLPENTGVPEVSHGICIALKASYNALRLYHRLGCSGSKGACCCVHAYGLVDRSIGNTLRFTSYGGPATIAQSLKAVAIGGVISIIGFIGSSSKEQPTFLDCLSNLCTVRGLLVGSRVQFEDMNKAIEANNIHPIVDKQEFSLEQLKEAYQYMFDQKNLGKVTIKIA